MTFISAAHQGAHHISYAQAGDPRQAQGACFPAAAESQASAAKANNGSFSITPQDRTEAKRRCDDHKSGQPPDWSITSWLNLATELVSR